MLPGLSRDSAWVNGRFGPLRGEIEDELPLSSLERVIGKSA